MLTAALIAGGLVASFLLAVAVGKAIKHGHDADIQFQRDLTDPNRDSRRDDRGEQS